MLTVRTAEGLIPRAAIEAYVARIVELFHPEQVILFGSYAWGEPTSDSDVDLIVVMPHEKKSWEKAAEIAIAIEDMFPMDLLVVSPERLAERIAIEDYFFLDLIEKGQVLHESGR